MMKKSVFGNIVALTIITSASVFATGQDDMMLKDNTRSECGRIAVGKHNAIVLKENNRDVELIGYDSQFRQISDSTRIRFVKLAMGSDGYMALAENGRIYVSLDQEFNCCRRRLEELRDVIDIAASENYVVALHTNGRVTCICKSDSIEKSDVIANAVSQWNNIIQVACGYDFVVGLRSNGTLVSAGNDYYCPSWQGLVQFDAFSTDYLPLGQYGERFFVRQKHPTIALLNNGAVVSNFAEEVELWKDVTKVSVGHGYAVGLKRDGTVYAMGDEYFVRIVESWKNVVDVECNYLSAVALLSDGTVETTINKYL